MESQEKHLEDGYLKYGVELLVDLHNAESIRARLEVRFAGTLGEYEVNRQILLTLGKLLPSFGLMGTLIGMVLLLGNIVTADPEKLAGCVGFSGPDNALRRGGGQCLGCAAFGSATIGCCGGARNQNEFD